MKTKTKMKTIRKQKGQALVEFAIILPLLMLVVLAILEFGMMLNSYMAIENASREGARIGIIGGTDTQIRNVIIITSPSLGVNDLTINITPVSSIRKSGDTLVVSVKYNYHLITPIISNLLNNIVTLSAETSMRIE